MTIESKKARFTGRIFRLMLDEGWVALEHEDGRREAWFVTEPGTIGDGSVAFPLGAPAAHG